MPRHQLKHAFRRRLVHHHPRPHHHRRQPNQCLCLVHGCCRTYPKRACLVGRPGDHSSPIYSPNHHGSPSQGWSGQLLHGGEKRIHIDVQDPALHRHQNTCVGYASGWRLPSSATMITGIPAARQTAATCSRSSTARTGW